MVSYPSHLARGDEIGLVLEDTPAGGEPQFLNLGGTTPVTALAIGSISLPMPEQMVQRIIDRKAFASPIKRLAERLGPLAGKTFPELWNGGGKH